MACYIYSNELGLEFGEWEDVQGNAIFVVARLRVPHAPRTLNDIAEIYCPGCSVTDPRAPHDEGCDQAGVVLI